MKCLVVNVGSSTVKLSIYGGSDNTLEQPSAPLWEGDQDCQTSDNTALQSTVSSMIRQAVEAGAMKSLANINVIGHRVVHGGTYFTAPVVIDSDVEAKIASLRDLAPLHTPGIVQAIRYFMEKTPGIPQVAVFDTAFHATMPEEAKLYPGPYAWKEARIIRYGFHGISHHYCSVRSAFLLGRKIDDLKIVTCHIGNGVSIAAIDRGRSVDTTMGFTPLEGAMMGTRSGTIDAAIIPYLEKQGLAGDQVISLLNSQSGLLGISGASGDMREILRLKADGYPRAGLALDMYVHSLIKQIGSMIGVLRGVDVLSFTGGVGEHVPEIRARVCGAFGFCGVVLDDAKNVACTCDSVISKDNSKVAVLVIKAEEDWAIACASITLISAFNHFGNNDLSLL